MVMMVTWEHGARRSHKTNDANLLFPNTGVPQLSLICPCIDDITGAARRAKRMPNTYQGEKAFSVPVGTAFLPLLPLNHIREVL